MALGSEKRRLIALLAAVERKRGGPDLSRLNQEQRAWFDAWRAERQSSATPAAAYAAMLAAAHDDESPLRSDIERAFYGDVEGVLKTDSLDRAAEKYRKVLA